MSTMERFYLDAVIFVASDIENYISYLTSKVGSAASCHCPVQTARGELIVEASQLAQQLEPKVLATNGKSENSSQTHRAAPLN